MTVLNATIFCVCTVLMASFPNSVNQWKLGLSLGILEGKGLS